MWDEPKEETSRSPENGIYSHPSVLDRTDPEAKSKKSHDTYSMGGVLVEVARWKPIDQTVNCLRDLKSSGNRENLLRKDSLTIIERNAERHMLRWCGNVSREAETWASMMAQTGRIRTWAQRCSVSLPETSLIG